MPFLYNFSALILKTTTIMKKFIIALVAVVLGLSSCSKEALLLGSWKFDSVTTTVGVTEMTYTAENLGLEVVYTFKENGKVEATLDGESGGEVNYTVAGNTLTISDEDMSMSFEFSVNSKTLVLSGNFGEIFGGESITNGRMTFKKI